MIETVHEKIQSLVDLETRSWNEQNPDLFLSMIHPDMVWPWPPAADTHDPEKWVFVLGRFNREQWRKSWQQLFDSHDLIHNRRNTVKIDVSKEQDGAFAIVDIDTLWRHKETREDSHWKGRVCKIYTRMSTGEWKLIFQTGALDFSNDKFRNLRAIIERLRAPDGCPWDRAQTKPDLGRYLIEEAYEVLEAIEGSPDHLLEELGDLLFQILFLVRMAEEADEFSLSDVLDEITAKMIRRHPHVFGDITVANIDEVRANWKKIKEDVEHKGKNEPSLCDDIPPSLSTLAKSQRITARAAEAGFDWKDAAGVLDKVEEELAEFRAALEAKDPERMQDEAGDLIFTLVNLCRHTHVDAEAALRSSLRKFTDRFSSIERELAARGMTPRDSSQAEMDRIWDETKKREG